MNLENKGTSRRHFCTRADVCRIEKMIEQDTVRLAPQDGPSVLKWIERLREAGHYVEFKGSYDPPPPHSNVENNAFFAGIDATHNTTHYENMSLFTLLVRDKWGHGTLQCS